MAVTRIPLANVNNDAEELRAKLDMSTAEIGLSVRTTNCLEEKGIFTVEDLLHCTRDDLLSISNFGEKTLEEVYKALEGIDFYRNGRRGRRDDDHADSWGEISFESQLSSLPEEAGPPPDGLGQARPLRRDAVLCDVSPLVGCVGLVVILVALVIPEWRANHEFVETICAVRSKELGQTQGEDGTLYRPEIGIEYAIDGEPHVAKTYDMCGSYSSDRAANQAILDRLRRRPAVPLLVRPVGPRRRRARAGIHLVALADVRRPDFVPADRRRRAALSHHALGQVGRAPGGDRSLGELARRR